MISLPLSAVGPGSSLWVEIAESPALTVMRVSPWFSLDALRGASSGRVTADVLGVAAERRGRPDQGAHAMGLPPELSVRDGRLVVEGGSVPSLIGSRPVAGALDAVRLVDSYQRDGDAPELRIDRPSGAVTAVDGTGAERALPPGLVLRSDEVRVELDLDAVGDLFDLDLDPELTALGLRRLITLAEGRTVVGEGVLATLASLTALVPAAPAKAPAPAATPAPTASAARSGPSPALVAAALALAVSALVVRSRVRRRRRAREEHEQLVRATEAPAPALIDRVPWAGADGVVTARAERVRLDLSRSELAVLGLDGDDDTSVLFLPDLDAPAAPVGDEVILPSDVLRALDGEMDGYRGRPDGP
jgi:hypothetical protein